MKQYNSLDMYDLSTLAQSDLNWLSIALTDVRKRVSDLKEEFNEIAEHSKYRFNTLEKILEMYEFIAEEREQDHAKLAEKYEKEMKEGQA